MAADAVTIRVAENGRLVLPSKQRHLLGLDQGGVVVSRVEDGEIRLRSVKAVVGEIQKIADQYFKDTNESVDKFLSDRRKKLNVSDMRFM